MLKSNDFGTKVKSKLRTSVLKSMTRSVSGTLRSMLGNGVVGKLANEAVREKAKDALDDGGFSELELQSATEAAFEQVRSQFVWHEAESRYVHASVMG